MPFGVQINKFKTYSDFTEYYIDFSVIQEENKEFMEVLKEIETKIKSLIVEQKMFSEDSLEEINVKFTSMLKENDGYPPLFKLNLPRKASGYFDFTVFNDDKEAVAITDSNIQDVLSKGNLCKVVFEIDKIWFFKDKYGITLKLNQLRLSKKEENNSKSNGFNGQSPVHNESQEDQLVSLLKKVSYTESMFLDD